MATKKATKYEWRKSDKPSTAAKPLSPQMHKKAVRLSVLVGDQTLADTIEAMDRFSITDLDASTAKQFKAKLLKLKAEYVKFPRHRRKAAWVKSITVLMDRFKAQEDASKDGKPVSKPKASKAKPKAKAAKPIVIASSDTSESQLAEMIAKAVAAALAAAK